MSRKLIVHDAKCAFYEMLSSCTSLQYILYLGCNIDIVLIKFMLKVDIRLILMVASRLGHKEKECIFFSRKSVKMVVFIRAIVV